jgi:hypothetical protein
MVATKVAAAAAAAVVYLAVTVVVVYALVGVDEGAEAGVHHGGARPRRGAAPRVAVELLDEAERGRREGVPGRHPPCSYNRYDYVIIFSYNHNCYDRVAVELLDEAKRGRRVGVPGRHPPCECILYCIITTL